MLYKLVSARFSLHSPPAASAPKAASPSSDAKPSYDKQARATESDGARDVEGMLGEVMMGSGRDYMKRRQSGGVIHEGFGSTKSMESGGVEKGCSNYVISMKGGIMQGSRDHTERAVGEGVAGGGAVGGNVDCIQGVMGGSIDRGGSGVYIKGVESFSDDYYDYGMKDARDGGKGGGGDHIEDVEGEGGDKGGGGGNVAGTSRRGGILSEVPLIAIDCH